MYPKIEEEKKEDNSKKYMEINMLDHIFHKLFVVISLLMPFPAQMNQL